jgi:hypothetical protein
VFADVLQWALLIGLAFLFGAVLGDLAARRRRSSSRAEPHEGRR